MYERGSKIFQRLLSFLDRLFDELYGSKYNPLYRSGTLAITVLSIATATGCYLLFFYRLGAPYESIVSISDNLLLSGWVRNLHRYSSDLAVVIVVFHVFRMIAEGKTWGPRLLAWITGVGLTVILFIIGWTGFILVWDRQAQALAIAGAKMMNVLPFFSGVLTRSVSGATPVGSSFYFLNLFLHMSLPLGMIFGIWLHTSNLNRPAWFPKGKFLYFFIGSVCVLSFLWPAAVAPPADLLDLNEKYSINIFYSFLIPLVNSFSPSVAFATVAGVLSLLLLIPFFWRPKKEKRPPVSVHNQAACTGCGQCALDCPFGAIDMVPRPIGTGSETVAFVDTSACVGCGICTASCTQMAIGPENKTTRVQMQKIKELKALHPEGGTLFVHCAMNSLGATYLSRTKAANMAAYSIECTGNFHVASATFALGHFKKVQIVGCPEHACINRLGQKLLEERFLHGREPKPPARMDFNQVQVFSGSLSDLDDLKKNFSANPPSTKTLLRKRIQCAVTTTLLLSTVAFFSSFPYERLLENSILRIAIRLPGQASEVCRDRKPEELAALPQHMRNAQDCTRKPIDYQLQVIIDGQVTFEKTLTASGVRGDKPIVVEDDLSVTPGLHQVSIKLNPTQVVEQGALSFVENFDETFEKGRAVLVSYNANTKILFHTKTEVK